MCEQGRRVLEILSSIQVAFSTLNGLFGNECTASRCSLITMASKLFLQSGSIEGALNTLRGIDVLKYGGEIIIQKKHVKNSSF